MRISDWSSDVCSSDLPVGEHAEALLRELVLGDAMEVVERRLGAPAEREEPVHVGLRPVEYASQLVPVHDLLEGKLLNRRAGDDEAVELLLADRQIGRESCRERVCQDV